ncbi:MAG: citrate transporter [Pseudomonadota bacterium]
MPQKAFSQYLAPLIGMIITFGFGYLPAIDPITPMGMKVLGAFLGMIFLWSFCSVLWSSLVGIIALAISGYAPMPKVVAMSFGDLVPVLIFFSMVLFGAIQDAGITRYMARWFLTRKMLNGRPFLFSFVFIYTTYLLGGLAANIMPVLLLMWSVLYSFLQEVGYKRGDRYTAIMVIGTLFGAISGQASKPFTGSALMIAGSFEKVANTNLNYMQYMIFGFILCSLCIVLVSLFIKFVLRPDVSRIANISVEHFEKDKLPPMDLRQKILAAVLAGFFILVLLPTLIPNTIIGMGLLSKMGPLGVAIAFVAGLCLFKVDGKPLMNFKEAAGKHVVWDVYLLVAMAMAISKAMTAEGMGITPFMMQNLDPILGGHGPIMFMALLILISCSVTQFANNGVMGVLLMPIIGAFAESNGIFFEATAVLVIFSTHIALLTPASSPYAAILYGNAEWIDKRDVVKYAICIFTITTLTYVLIGIPVANMIYG